MSEMAIQLLLEEAGLSDKDDDLVWVDPRASRSPPTGRTWSLPRTTSATSARRASPPDGAAPDESRVYAAPPQLGLNQWALAGTWTWAGEFAELNEPGGSILNRFHARDLHMVLGPAERGSSVRFRVLIDGEPPGTAHGGDVDAGGNGTVTEQRLYQLVRQPGAVGGHTFSIEFLDPAVRAFAFTFG